MTDLPGPSLAFNLHSLTGSIWDPRPANSTFQARYCSSTCCILNPAKPANGPTARATIAPRHLNRDDSRHQLDTTARGLNATARTHGPLHCRALLLQCRQQPPRSRPSRPIQVRSQVVLVAVLDRLMSGLCASSSYGNRVLTTARSVQRPRRRITRRRRTPTRTRTLRP